MFEFRGSISNVASIFSNEQFTKERFGEGFVLVIDISRGLMRSSFPLYVSDTSQ